MRRLLAVASGLAALVALAIPVQAAAEPALPAGFQDETVFAGLEQPTNFRFAPDGRVFVAEKPGRILVFDNLEDTTRTVFADLRGDVYDNGDRGLLGFALDPEFEEGRPYVYALYTWDHVLGTSWDPEDPEYGKPNDSGDIDCPSQNTSNSCLVSGRLVRLTENEAEPDHAVKEGGLPKEEELLQGWCQQFNSHSVGELEFGPEGALYVSGGDGASYESIPDYGELGTPANPCGDPPTAVGVKPETSPGKPMPDAQGGALRAQNPKLLNGALLRIDPDTGAALPDNPQHSSGDENTRRTIGKGFRNPFRFTFDPVTGETYVSNVGSSQIEEIDRLEAHPSALYNSGWPCFEGISRQFQYKDLGLDTCENLYDAEEAEEPETSLPFFNYSHNQTVVPEDECPTDSGSALGGISFYEGSQFPAAYKGALFFSDVVRGCVWVMFPGDDGKPDPTTTQRFMREGKIYPGVEISEGPGGYLYYATLTSNEGLGDGGIHRIAYRPNSPTAKLEAKPPFGLYDGGGDFETTVDAGKSSDPNGDPLSYEWDLNEDGVFEVKDNQPTRNLTFTEAEQDTREGKDESPNRVIAVRVEDDESFTSVARVTIYPGDKPPVVTIIKPTSSEHWGVGDLVKLDANATDANGDPIVTPLPYYWVTRMAHCPDLSNPTACHVHPLQTFAGIRRPEFIAPQHDYPSYIDVVLRVSDDRGLSGTAALQFKPRTVNLSLASNPPGVELLAASTEAVTPFSVPAIDGSEIQLSAPQTAVLGGKTFTFSGWSDGGGREHPILVSAQNAAFTATYTGEGEEGEQPGGGGSDGGSGGGGGGPVVPPPAVSPQTTIRKHPPASTRSRNAKFVFAADVSAGFACKLDGKAKAACGSPKTYKKLKPGRHTFKVWATAGVLTDPTPAKFSWKILPPKR
jgi:glucose/arabinose dehydrogenase